MLVQKGTQKIEIIVKKDSGGASGTPKEKDPQETGGGQAGSTSFVSRWNDPNSTFKQRFIRVNATHTYAVARQVMGLGINYAIQGLGDMYGDQALQDGIQREMEIMQDVTGFASSVGMGITYGASGGIPGMIIGGVLGAISGGASLAVKYKTREREFNYKVFKESNAIEYQRSRASINLTTGRLR